MTTDVEMRDEEMRKKVEKKRVSIEAIRKKFSEWDYWPYQYQKFNLDQGSIHVFTSPHALFMRPDPHRYNDHFNEDCEFYQSFDFSIEPTMVGEVKHCSYSELDKMTNFKNPLLIQKTLTGRLFRGTIFEGSVSR